MFVKLLAFVIQFPFNSKKYYPLFIVGMLSTLTLHFIGIGPSLMIIPILFAAGYPMFDMGLRALFSKKGKVTFVAKCFALTGVITAVHTLDFAYAYTHPEWLFAGFTMAFIGVFSLTTFSTAAVLETLAVENTQMRMQAEYGAMIANSARLASLGQMASGMAHEINNPLAIIQMHAHQLKRFLKDKDLNPETALKGATIIEETVFRINKIITGLRSFGRDAGNDPLLKVSLAEVVNSTLQFTSAQFSSRGIEIRKNFFPEVQAVCRPVQISQVIFNLLNNSFDAIRDSQTEKWIKIEIYNEGNCAKLVVSDNGSGIDSLIRDKIFYPFFTTKEIGGGAGLGLSSSLGIVEANHGELSLSQDTEHTTFILSLPKA
jgi:signal transduction histidine kinase